MERHDDRARAAARSLCADLHDDDGVPASHRTDRHHQPRDDRKTRQLCAQVARTLHGVLPDPTCPALEHVRIDAVLPHPDASRLRVVVTLPPEAGVAASTVRAALDARIPQLRSAIAAAIHRTRVPRLVLDLVPREDPR